MIISHRYRFIFIKTKKTAGTSIEIALSRFLGPRDVITHISPEDEALKRALGYPGPRNFYVPFRRYSLGDWREYRRTRRRLYFYNHMPARDIRRLVGARRWRGYFKFCFERNPWDKVISWYYWEHPRPPRPSLAEFVRAGRAGDLAGPGGTDLYTIDGETAVDRIFRYENLEAAVEELTEILGLPEVPVLPRAKSRFRQDPRPYREVYGPERDVIEQAFARPIRECGYRF